MFRSGKKLEWMTIISVLLVTMGLSGCQKQDEPANFISDESIEEAQPMTAEPAEAEAPLVLDTTQDTNDIDIVEAEDLQADNMVSYVCTPALEVNAYYHVTEKNVVLDINDNSITLALTNEGETPMVYSNEQGAIQWRVTQDAQNDIGTAVLRMPQDGKVQSYECGATS